MSKFQDLIEKAMRGEPLDEVSPPGFKGTVKAMKKRHSDEIDNPYALSWWMKNKGYKSHKKATGGPKDESIGDDRDDDSSEYDWKYGLRKFGPPGIFAHLLAQKEKEWKEQDAKEEPKDESRGTSNQNMATGDLIDQTFYPSSHQLFNDPEISKDEFPPRDGDPDLPMDEETGDNWSTTDGSGATGYPGIIATDALPEIPLQYDYDIEKLPESFDFSLTEVEGTLASQKGIKRASQKGNEGAKDVKFIPEPDGSKRPDYKMLGAKDVQDADNLSDEAISDSMRDSAYEDIRIEHSTKGKGTVIEITDKHLVVEWDRTTLRILGPERIPLSETKYIIRIKERYASKPEEIDVVAEKPKGNKKMAKKQKVDEAMAAIQSTMRYTGDGYKLPVIDLSPEDIGLISEYEVPDPGDSVLTGQDQQKAPKIEPLSTERGADAAHDDIYPDGDYGKDLVPADAPDTPDYNEMGDEAGNPRSSDGSDYPAADLGSNSSGKSDDYHPSDYNEKKWGDKDKSEDNKVTGGGSDENDSDEKDEDKDMKESKGLTWKDIGLNVEEVISEMNDVYEEGCGDMYGEGYGGMRETHDVGAGDVAFTPELLKKLLVAVRDQSPDDEKLQRMCDALKDSSAEKGATLDDTDMGTVMSKFKTGASGGVEADESPEMADSYLHTPTSAGGPDQYEGNGESNEGGNVRGHGQGTRGSDPEGARDDDHGDAASKYHGKAWAHEEEGEDDDNDDDEHEDDDYEDDQKYQEQDKAAGDGEEAGPEGGDEHEGKTKLMDKKGRDHDKDGDIDSDDWKMARDKAIKSRKRKGERKAKAGRKYASMETKGGKKKIKPISSNTSKGSGPGGSNATGDGQDPLIPQMDNGNQLGAHGTPLSPEGGGRTVKPISESMVAMGMASIGGTVRNAETHSDDGLSEEEKELRMIKRRAGIEDWWK